MLAVPGTPLTDRCNGRRRLEPAKTRHSLNASERPFKIKSTINNGRYRFLVMSTRCSKEKAPRVHKTNAGRMLGSDDLSTKSCPCLARIKKPRVMRGFLGWLPGFTYVADRNVPGYNLCQEKSRHQAPPGNMTITLELTGMITIVRCWAETCR